MSLEYRLCFNLGPKRYNLSKKRDISFQILKFGANIYMIRIARLILFYLFKPIGLFVCEGQEIGRYYRDKKYVGTIQNFKSIEQFTWLVVVAGFRKITGHCKQLNLQSTSLYASEI